MRNSPPWAWGALAIAVVATACSALGDADSSSLRDLERAEQADRTDPERGGLRPEAGGPVDPAAVFDIDLGRAVARDPDAPPIVVVTEGEPARPDSATAATTDPEDGANEHPDSGGQLLAVTSEDLLDVGVAQGVWSEAEGVVAMLEIVLGERQIESVPAFAQLDHHSMSHIVETAERLVSDAGPTSSDGPGQAALIERLGELVDALHPDLDDPAVLVEPAPAGLVEPASFDVGDVVIAPAVLDMTAAGSNVDRSRCRALGEAVPRVVDRERVVDCWYSISRTAEISGRSYTAVVYYPQHWAWVDGRARADGEPPTEREEHARTALDALMATNTYAGGLHGAEAAIDIRLWFAQHDLPRVDEQGIKSTGTALASTVARSDRPCRIAVFPASFDSKGFSVDALRFSVSHEAFHCQQHRAWGGASPGAWIHEGGADMLAAQVVPEHGREAFIDRFDRESLTRSLTEMSYDTAVFWQFLANQTSVKEVWDLHRRLALKGGSLSDEDGIDVLFHEFVRQWSTTGVPDVNGNPMPRRPARVLKGGPIDRVGSFGVWPIEPLVAARVRYRYEPGAVITHRETGSPPASASFALSGSTSRWGPFTAELPEEQTTPCDDPLYLLAVSTTHIGVVEQRIVVSDIREANCDLCIAGTWRLDNDHLQSLVLGGATDPELTSFLQYVGEYVVHFGTDGRLWAQRDGWGVQVGGPGGATNVSTALETARYGAGDGILDITDYEIVFGGQAPSEAAVRQLESTSMLSGLSEVFGGDSQTSASGGSSARFGFECSGDELRYGWTGGPDAFQWWRWERIPDRPAPAGVD